MKKSKRLRASKKRKHSPEQKRKNEEIKQNLKANNPPQQKLINLFEHYKNGRHVEAEELALAITQKFPHHQFRWKVLGAVLKQSGRLGDSLTATQQSVKLAPQDAEAHNNLGNTLNELGRLDEALASYNQAVALKPDFFEAHFSIGITLNELDRLDEAITSYNQAIAMKPGYAEAHLSLGITLNELGRLDEAITSYNQAIALKPDYADAYNNMGNVLKIQGRLDKALEAYSKALSLQPDYAEAFYNTGIILTIQGKLDEATEAYSNALSLKPDFAEAHYNMGRALNEQDKRDEAIEAYKKALSIKPEYAEAYYNIGNALIDQGKLDEAIEAYKKALSFKPDDADAYNNLGNALKIQGRLEEAIEAYNSALSLKADYAGAHNNIGLALKDQGKLDKAIEAYKKALSVKPDYAEAYYNIGNALNEQNKLREAIEAYKEALSIKPEYAEAYYNIGNALIDQGKLDEAIEAYKTALSLKADYAEPYNNMGNALKDQGKLKEAIEAYKTALSLKLDYVGAYNNMGLALKEQDKLDEAIEAYNNALSFKPDYAEAYYNKGNALKEQGKLDEAIEAYDNALLLKPDLEGARASKLHQEAHICKWESIAKDNERLPKLGTIEQHVAPFAMLALEDAPDRHRIRSEKYAAAEYPRKSMSTWPKPLQKPERLRIGYFSADFHDFPGMYLMVGLLEKHDRTKFEISAFSYGPDIHDQMRKRIVKAVDHFIDIRTADVSTVVDLARQRNIDIAVHRNGYTQNNKTELFAAGLAPIQINYLGYPGTLGADYIDYIVADRFVIPDDMQRNYSEHIMYLPNTYQPTDDRRTISDEVITREDMGLPDHAFVFCCFNNNYKISSREFDIWMRLLIKVEGSVLWLLKSNKWAEQNLKQQAAAIGVSAERIIFAERLPQAEHLARHRLANLFLDTFNYNAHTTASDALWAGLPVVTKAGQGFAARVAGSLLNAIGLPELVTNAERDYEELALELARHPTKLAQVKAKLAANRLTEPLFNTELYTKHLENGYQQAYQCYFDNKPPQTIIVPR